MPLSPAPPPVIVLEAPKPKPPPAPTPTDVIPHNRIDASEVVIDESKKLGVGGFGVVYEGVLWGANEVAVKVIKGSIDEKTIREFRKEIGIWGFLQHRNVLPLMAYCEDPPMMISELVRDGNLRTFMVRKGWDQKLGVKLLRDVALGMAYLHSRPTPVLHGDLKAFNILIDGPDGARAYITDFGMSRIRAEITLTTSGIGWGGTPGFMAPELYSMSLKAPADVYAFGSVCYEVGSRGRFPFWEAKGNHTAVG
jgi:serine/threonine protein kinase